MTLGELLKEVWGQPGIKITLGEGRMGLFAPLKEKE